MVRFSLVECGPEFAQFVARKHAVASAFLKAGVPSVAFLGKGGGTLAGVVDESIIVASDDTSVVQLIHMALQHLIVELVERELLIP